MEETEELDNLLGSEEGEEPKETEEGEGGEEEEKETKEEFVMPEKFKGKSPEEIAKSYTELEKMIERKAREKAEEILRKKEEEGEGAEEEEAEEEVSEIKTPIEEKTDFSEMTPEQFADWVIQQIERRAEEKARLIYEESSKVKESVSAEIAEAQKAHPLLKTSADYRELALSIIESAASKGKIVSLEDACNKIDKLVGKKEGEVEEEEKEKLKKAKAIVEKTGVAPAGGRPDTEEEMIRKSLLGGTKSPLGGLGI